MHLELFQPVQHFLFDTLDSLGGGASFIAAEIGEGRGEMLKEYEKAFEGVAEQKTSQFHTFIAVVMVPIALVIGGLAIKFVYGMFTKTADKVGKGLGNITSKIKLPQADEGKKASDSSLNLPPPPVDPSKSTQKRRMLFGEIIVRFVNPTVSSQDVEQAVQLQKAQGNGKKLGQVMAERGLISDSDIIKALKIQEKSGSKRAS